MSRDYERGWEKLWVLSRDRDRGEYERGGRDCDYGGMYYYREWYDELEMRFG